MSEPNFNPYQIGKPDPPPPPRGYWRRRGGMHYNLKRGFVNFLVYAPNVMRLAPAGICAHNVLTMGISASCLNGR
jgi:hypothetical protein